VRRENDLAVVAERYLEVLREAGSRLLS
jgi:hypothetical protein